MSVRPVTTKSGSVVTDPPLARLLFDDTRFSVVWLVVRVLLGLAWLQPGLDKLTNPKWMDGSALAGFWGGAVKNTKFVWYGGFLQSLIDSGSATWFAKLVALGEFTVGVALIIGAFVGIAAFFGGFMNWNYIMAGTASTNGLLFLAAMLLILAWKTAGHLGADRFLLPLLGTPWGRGANAESGAQQPANPQA